ncbi:MAG: dockerin type I repeat-containing protein [candidate division Zixibacteria bacterium]|nr:dockerin type I repeat-containing protein [candidate division Zixibacteria bacterium]
MRKTPTTFFLLFAIILFYSHPLVFAQDPGTPDTVRFLSCGSYVSCPPCTGRAVVPIVVVNDEPLREILISLRWTGAMVIDSVVFLGERSRTMHQTFFEPYNSVKVVVFGGIVFLGEEPIPPGNGVLINLFFTVQDTGSVRIDTAQTPIPESFYFIDDRDHYFLPRFYPFEFQIRGYSTLLGDVNQDGHITVSDVIRLVDYLFKEGRTPGYPPSGDVTGDGKLGMVDVIYLVNFLFRGGPAPGGGCFCAY